MSNWLTVVRAAHRRRNWPSWDDIIWLLIYTVVGSLVAIMFIEGMW